MLKLAITITLGLIMSFLLLVASVYFYFQWRKGRQYDDKITITATYMQYACGDCSIDMNVKLVDNPNYKFIIGHDILPTPSRKKRDELCDYISDEVYKEMKNSDDYSTQFTLTGYLHKCPHGLPWVDCSETPFFTVEKIKYDANNRWFEF